MGVQVVSRYGGRTLVQDEATSRAYSMPAAALAADSPDAPIALDDLAAAIASAVTERPAHAHDMPARPDLSPEDIEPA